MITQKDIDKSDPRDTQVHWRRAMELYSSKKSFRGILRRLIDRWIKDIKVEKRLDLPRRRSN